MAFARTKRDIPTSKIPFCRQVGRSVAYPEMVQLRPDEMCGGKGGGGGQSAGAAEKNNSVGFYQPQQNGEWEIKLFIIKKLSFFNRLILPPESVNIVGTAAPVRLLQREGSAVSYHKQNNDNNEVKKIF